jgi:hypothetical protein
MSVGLNAKAFSTWENKEFQKHLKAVKFCIENELSFPIETSNFFKGKIGGDNLEDVNRNSILKYIENGCETNMPFRYFKNSEVHIRPAEIPKYVDLIIVSLT